MVKNDDESREDPPPTEGEDDTDDDNDGSSDGEGNEDENHSDPEGDSESGEDDTPTRKPSGKARKREANGDPPPVPEVPDFGKALAEASDNLRKEFNDGLQSIRETLEKGAKDNGGGNRGNDSDSPKTESRRGRGFLWGGN